MNGRPSDSSGPPSGPGSGALLFTRYAYPPNELGLCGPDAAAELLDRVREGAADPGLRALLRGFEGAWPYLELIAAAARIRDPLDPRVVRAYWIGNDLLARVGPVGLGRSLEDRFRTRVTPDGWTGLSESVPAGAVPHHSAHVLLVYPWVGLLRQGRVTEPLHVLEQCSVRWGHVVAVLDDTALVQAPPLTWDGRTLSLGPPRLERARLRRGPAELVDELAIGDWCALHWGWVCDRLSPAQVQGLRRWTQQSIDAANSCAHPAPAAVLA